MPERTETGAPTPSSMLTGGRMLVWAGLVLMIAVAWIALAVLHPEAELTLETVRVLCLEVGTGAELAFYPAVLAMWLLMSVAMMLPTAMPAIDLYASLARRMESGGTLRIALFTGGYLIAWGAFSAVAAAAQLGLGTIPANLLPPALAGGVVLIVAGAYQLSALKARCLAKCRNPMMFLMSHWREDLPGTLRLGILHGIICVGCCWALMLLMFIGGTMNLFWMALLGLAMLGEKVLPHAETWGRGAGVLMIAVGVCVVFVSQAFGW